MRKKITLLTLFALSCVAYSAMAQTTELVEMKSRVARERYDDLGNVSYVWENEYWDNYYYDGNGKNVLYTRYRMEPTSDIKERLYEQTFYEYNQAGQLMKERQQYFDYTYEYNNNGLLAKKNQVGKNGESMNTWEYFYNDDNLLTEELEKNNGTLNGKTVYRYNSSKQLDVKLTYENQYSVGLVVKDSIVYTYKDGNVDTRFTYRYPETEAKDPFEKVYSEWGMDGLLKADSTYTVDNYGGGTEIKPTGKNCYFYKKGKLECKKSFSYDSATGYFSMEKGEENYAYGKVGSHYIATNFKVEGSNKPGAVKLSFTAPVQTEGLEGYKVIVDGELKDEPLIDKSKTEYVLEGQTRGDHSYYLVSVYNGMASNMTEGAKYSVEIDLPAPTNIRLASYEKTFSGWRIIAVWDTPEIPDNLHFKNYELKVVYPTYEQSNTAEANRCDFSYYANKDGEEMQIRVVAVYEEGTSDYVSFKKILSESDQVTAHWQNSEKIVKSADGTVTGSIRYYYTANGDNEKLYAEIEYDGKGQPKGKSTQIADMGELKAIMHYGWNGNEWIQDQKITYDLSKETFQLESKTTYTADEEGALNVVASKEVYTYDDGSCGAYDLPAKTEYMKPDKNGNLAVSSVAKHTYVPSADWTSYDVVDSLYAADGITLTGKIERDYITSTKGMTRQNVYTYKENAFVPVSKLSTEFSPENGLPAKETMQEYKNNEWVDKQMATFTASSAYHKDRVVTSVKAKNADEKVTLTWVAPVRTDSLESYKILINDIEKEVVPATTLTAEYANIGGGYTHRFRVIGIFKGMESMISDESSVKVAVPVYATIKELKEGYSDEYTGLVNLTGEVLVTGVTPIGMSSRAYTEDETGALRLAIVGTSPFGKGDKISNLKGYLEKLNGLYTLTAESVSKENVVSENNSVTPVVKTATELKTSYEADQSKYIKVENAKLELNDTEIVLNQNGETLKLYRGLSGIDPDALNGHTLTVSGHVTIEQDGYGIIINNASDIVDGISTVTAHENIYYVNGEVVAEGADLIEVFDVAGCQLGMSNKGRISVSPMGTLIVKATYNGEVKISKIAVK